MTALLLVVLSQAGLSQAPADVPVALVVSSRRDTTNAAPALVDQLKIALAAQGITAMGDADSVARLKLLGGVDPKACDGSRLCLQKLAQLLQGVVVGVDVSKAGRLTAGHVEAVAYDRVESLAVDDVTSDAKSWNKTAGEAATAFAQKLKAPLAAMNEARRPKEAPPKVAEKQPELKTAPPLETPREATLTPEPPPTPPPAVPVEATTQKSGLGPVPYVTTGVAIVALGAGIVCLILGFIDRGTYVGTFERPMGLGTDVASMYTDAQLRNLAQQSNVRIGVGTGLVALAAALGITSGILFAKE